ncbi:MAG: hypothetical protein CMJ49_14365 [Planctomycetaceae bacterium]|nr:hypothetical protein [Planctomycetaceae bacterium]
MLQSGDPLIHLLCARFSPERHGGVEQRMAYVARELAAAGQRVEVLTENRTGSPANEVFGPGLIVRRFDPLECGRLWRWRDRLRLRWWKRVIREVGVGTLWATDPIMATAAINAGRGDDLVFNPACCAAALDMAARQYPGGEASQMSRTLQRFDATAWQQAPRVVVSSGNLCEQFVAMYGGRDHVDVVPHGVCAPRPFARVVPGASDDLHGERLGIERGAFVVGFVGRLDPVKDLGFLFEAAARVPDEAAIHLLIVGDGPDEARLKKLALARGILDRITWTGALDDPCDAYAAMDVMVLPSWYEAFGNVILEAMAHGVPVIGRRRDATGRRPVLTAAEELIDHHATGAVIDAHDVTGLARELTRLYRLPAVRRAMGNEARREAAKRPWGETVAAYLRILGSSAAVPMRRAA